MSRLCEMSKIQKWQHLDEENKYISIIQCQIYGLELKMILINISVTNHDSNK